MYINIEFRIFAIQIFLFIDCEEVVIHMMTYTRFSSFLFTENLFREGKEQTVVRQMDRCVLC